MSAPLSERLKERDIPYTENVSGATLTTFRIGGICPLLITPRCEGELTESAALCLSCGVPFHVIGNGSNLLLGDGRLSYALIRTAGLDAINVRDACFEAECGVGLPRLANAAATHGFADLVFLSGIPGTVGGGVGMNAGAYGKSLSDVVESVTALTLPSLKKRTLFNEELSFSYRSSIFQRENLILIRARFRLSERAEPTAISEKMRQLAARRRAAQPLEFPSAGSTFRRPAPDLPLAPIFEELGLKGLSRGGAEVSRKHAGFIVNRGGATAADVRALIAEIREITLRERGFSPEPEIIIYPEDV